MAIEAGNQIDEEAIDERSERRAKRKKRRTKIADNAQIENQKNADQEKDVDDNQARLKCFTNYRPKVAVLWSVNHDRGIFDFIELMSILEKKGFALIDDRGYWRRFRFTEGDYSREQTLERNTPRLPYSELQGCHPSVYLNFIEDVAKWIGREETSKAFTIKIIDVGNEVSCWEDGIFPCSWKKEKWTLWYKSMSLDSSTKTYIKGYDWAEEYMSDFEGNLQEKVDEREAAISDLIKIMAYDEGVSEEWRNNRLVCLWDVKRSRAICTRSEMNTILEKIGVPDKKQEIFPWLPYPYMMGCHPLVYFLFLQSLERHIDRDAVRKALDLRGIPVALVPEEYLDSPVSYNSTVWKQNLGYKYRITLLIKDALKELESLKEYMLGFGVDRRVIKKYCADVVKKLKSLKEYMLEFGFVDGDDRDVKEYSTDVVNELESLQKYMLVFDVNGRNIKKVL